MTAPKSKHPEARQDREDEGNRQAGQADLDPLDPRDVEGRPDLRRDRRRRRPQRPRQRRVPRQVRPQDADPRAPPPRRRRGHHRGAAPRLLVHDVLVRPEPAPPADHPGPRADQARLHAAADVDDLRARRRGRLPVVHPGPRPEPEGDRAALQARRRRLRPVQPRHGDGLPGHQAAPRHGPARHLQRRPRGAHRARVASARGSRRWTSACSTTRSAC